jgi:hypothetical protein
LGKVGHIDLAGFVKIAVVAPVGLAAIVEPMSGQKFKIITIHGTISDAGPLGTGNIGKRTGDIAAAAGLIIGFEMGKQGVKNLYGESDNEIVSGLKSWLLVLKWGFWGEIH